MDASKAQVKSNLEYPWARGLRWSIAAGVMLVLVPGADLRARETAAQDAASSALVHLREIDASIVQDIRYAGPDNFTGRPVPGYAAAECLLLRDVADALSRVQKELQPRGLGLKVYDCYRPRRAVRAFRAWVAEPGDAPAVKRFHPNLDRRELIGLGYIAAVSRHSRGDTVDLTLVALPDGREHMPKRRIAFGPCNGPAGARGPGETIDMGTSFDCFDDLSHTRAAGITPEQRRWRQVLVDAMARHGFQNYHKEWWHFTYRPERRGRSFDVPIEPLAR